MNSNPENVINTSVCCPYLSIVVYGL